MKNIFSKSSYVFFSIAGSVFLLFLGAYVFLNIHTKKLAKETAEDYSQLAVLNKKNDDLQSLRKTLRSTEEDRKLLDTHFVSEANVARFLSEIEGFGVETKTNVKLESVKQEGEPKTLLLNLRANGEFSDLMALVKLMEQAPYAIVVDKLLLNKRINPTSSVSVTPAPSSNQPPAQTTSQIVDSSTRSKWDAEIVIRLISYIP